MHFVSVGVFVSSSRSCRAERKREHVWGYEYKPFILEDILHFSLPLSSSACLVLSCVMNACDLVRDAYMEAYNHGNAFRYQKTTREACLLSLKHSCCSHNG
jgi:hypothetical protein